MESVKPLYTNIYELIEFRGIKQGAVAQAMHMSYNNWYKSKRRNLQNITIDEICRLAQFLDLPAAEVFTLCLAVSRRDED